MRRGHPRWARRFAHRRHEDGTHASETHGLTQRTECVIVSNMKTASVRHVQHNLREVLAWVERGEEVLVLRRSTVVARLVPPGPAPAETPDFLARARGIWGKKPRGTTLSEIVSQARGKR
jgi:antitoxin (DNA-binding transcriptional repressor) of toxin-antitoxin stability system